MRENELIHLLVNIDLRLELIQNKMRSIGLTLEPVGDRDSVADIFASTQTIIDNALLDTLGIDREDDITFGKYNDVLKEISNISELTELKRDCMIALVGEDLEENQVKEGHAHMSICSLQKEHEKEMKLF